MLRRQFLLSFYGQKSSIEMSENDLTKVVVCVFVCVCNIANTFTTSRAFIFTYITSFILTITLVIYAITMLILQMSKLRY